jgi:g-D-glutamyl-meso-diaminopimelate peptidase
LTFTYVVREGDTLFRIARRYSITLQSLINANPQLSNTDYVLPGQVIYVPIRPPNLYVIQAGDTFYKIAQKFNIALNDLLSANPHIDPQRLIIGQTVTLPISRGMNIIDTTNPYGYEELIGDIALLRQLYPFIESATIGQSVLGREIPVIRIGTGPRQYHYNGSFHANEWITTPVVMKFIEDYAKAYTGSGMWQGQNVRALFEQTSLWIVPMVNPDGVELVLQGLTPQNPYFADLLEWNAGSFDFSTWKANIRGVDLNDQFPAHWEEEQERRGELGPGPRDYGGTAPLTEPETIAMANFTQSHDFRLVIAFHTQGKEIYWNYRGLEPPESEAIANLFAQASGYTPVELTGSDAGYKDWFIQDFRRPGFTVECGEGTNPLPIAQFSDIYRDVSKIMLVALSQG